MITLTEQINRLAHFLEADEMIIEPRFQGPPRMANGGYVAGRLAEYLGTSPVEVTLRKPIPLARPLTLSHLPDGTVLLVDGDTLLAEAVTTTFDLDVPPYPSFAQAVYAHERYAGFEQHPFPACFVCGPLRHNGDGLRIFPGPVYGRDLVAAPWIPDPSLADATGQVQTRYLWAALDCPGAFAFGVSAAKPVVLGRLTGVIWRRVTPVEPCVVTGWSLGQDGRKHFAGTAIFTARGELIGKAKAIWFER